MKLEVLLSTMNQIDISIYNKMKITTDAIIINQTKGKIINKNLKLNGNKIRMYSFNEKGVGLSRNTALMRSDSEICLMADDDMVYVDNYSEIIKNTYNQYPDADMIVFNLRVHTNNGVSERVKKNSRVRWYNCLRYGTPTFTFKKNSIYKKNIYFSLLFGGGAKYSSGEDSLFIWECLKKGLKIYSCDKIIADVYNYKSTWFTGYDRKYFIDKGVLFDQLSPRLSKLLCLRFAVFKYSLYSEDMSFKKAINYMLEGIVNSRKH